MAIDFKLNHTELHIVNILLKENGFLKTSKIVLAYQQILPNTPKQTIYRTIRGLKQKEVVVITKGVTSINTQWISVLRQKLNQLELGPFHQFIPDRISHTFPSFLSIAPVLTHHVNILISQSDKKDPVIFINPHQLFYAARDWSEERLINNLESEGYTLWQGINYISAIDKNVLKKKFTNRPHIRGSFIEAKKGEEDIYINIIGEYVLRVTTTPEFSRALNELYDMTKTATQEFANKLQELLTHSGPVKMVIVKRKAKAQIYRNLMKKFIATKK